MKKFLTVFAATAMLTSGAFATSYFVADYSFPGIPCFPGVSFGWNFTAEGSDGVTVYDVIGADIGGMMQYEVIFAGVGIITMQLDNCDQGTDGAIMIAAGVPDDGFGVTTIRRVSLNWLPPSVISVSGIISFHPSSHFTTLIRIPSTRPPRSTTVSPNPVM